MIKIPLASLQLLSVRARPAPDLLVRGRLRNLEVAHVSGGNEPKINKPRLFVGRNLKSTSSCDLLVRLQP
jgi:hypothetical protein